MDGGQWQAGACRCGAIAYQMSDSPLFVHCCHCTDCQTETGSAFALNALIERERLTVTRGAPEPVLTPSASGKGQEIWRCRECRVALWSHYPSRRRKLAFVRVGTLGTPAACPPDVHIFTRSKLPWLVLGDAVPAFESYYDADCLWPAESRARRAALDRMPHEDAWT